MAEWQAFSCTYSCPSLLLYTWSGSSSRIQCACLLAGRLRKGSLMGWTIYSITSAPSRSDLLMANWAMDDPGPESQIITCFCEWLSISTVSIGSSRKRCWETTNNAWVLRWKAPEKDKGKEAGQGRESFRPWCRSNLCEKKQQGSRIGKGENQIVMQKWQFWLTQRWILD